MAMTKAEQEKFRLELEEIAKQHKGPYLDLGGRDPFWFMTWLDAVFQAKDSKYGPV